MIKTTKTMITGLSLAAILALSGCTANNPSTAKVQNEPSLLEAYANIANDNYKDALYDAKLLQTAINKFAHSIRRTAL